MLAQVVLFDGFDPLDVIGPYETLTAAEVRTELVAVEGQRDVPAGMNLLSLKATARPSRQRPPAIATPGTAAAPSGGQDRRMARSPRPPRGSGPIPAYRAIGRDGRRSAICGQVAGARHSPPSCPQIAEQGLDNALPRLKSESALRGGLPPGWAGPRRGSISRLIEREIGAQKALEVEALFAHERRGTAWRAA